MRTRSLLVAMTMGMLPVGIALPASADPTDVSVTVTAAGTLSITVPADAGSLGTLKSTPGGGTINGSLGTVQVLDERGVVGGGWVMSAISTALTPFAGPTIAASLIGYTAGVITKVGTATYTANDPADLTGVVPVVTATGITGDNSATWNPTINVAVPGGMAAGVYTGTITHSVV